MSVKFKLSDLHIRKQNGTFGDLTALKGDRGLTAVQVSGTQPTDPDIDVWFKDQQSAPVMVYTTDEINDMIAPAETSPTQAAHHVGEYIICVINGQAKLYKVIAEISPGETLTVGGNIEAINVTDRIAILENKIKITSPLSVPALNAGDYADIVDQSVTAQVRFVQIIDYTVGRILYPANWWNDSSTGYLNMRVYNLSSTNRQEANARFTYYLA